MMLSRRSLLAGLAAMPPALALAQGRPPVRPAVPARRVVDAAGLPGTVAFALLDSNGALADAALAGAPMMPASTMKAVTALYAISRLGAGHRFRTRIIGSGDTLVLAGGGDPVLTTDDLARLAGDLDVSVRDDGDTGGVVTPVLETLHPGDEHL